MLTAISGSSYLRFLQIRRSIKSNISLDAFEIKKIRDANPMIRRTGARLLMVPAIDDQFDRLDNAQKHPCRKRSASPAGASRSEDDDYLFHDHFRFSGSIQPNPRKSRKLSSVGIGSTV